MLEVVDTRETEIVGNLVGVLLQIYLLTTYILMANPITTIQILNIGNVGHISRPHNRLPFEFHIQRVILNDILLFLQLFL